MLVVFLESISKDFLNMTKSNTTQCSRFLVDIWRVFTIGFGCQKNAFPASLRYQINHTFDTYIISHFNAIFFILFIRDTQCLSATADCVYHGCYFILYVHLSFCCCRNYLLKNDLMWMSK